MTISKKAIYGGHRDQVLQDLASNIDVLQSFIADQKAKLLSSAVNWQFTADGAEPDIIDMVVAENAAASIHQLVIAEINGGYRYAEVVPDDDAEPAWDLTKRTTIFAAGQPVGPEGDDRREFEVYAEDLWNPSLRKLTFAIGVGSADEKHIVFPNVSDHSGFLKAMAKLQATPFTHRTGDEEAA